jgi:hypothetical protein
MAVLGDDTFGQINFRNTNPLAVDIIGPEGTYDITGVKPSPSALMANRVMKTKPGTTNATGETKEPFLSRFQKGDITSSEMLGLSALSSGVNLATGLYDINRQAKRESQMLAEKTASIERQLEASGQLQQEQSRADFEQAMQQREAQFQLTQEVREKQFNASMDMIAERSGIAKDQLMNDVQFSQTVANINELNSLLNLAKQQQPVGENTQQFFS